MKRNKPKIEVERVGLCIFASLPGADTVLIEYQACTHGGWAKYLNDGLKHVANFESEDDCYEDLRSTYTVVPYPNEDDSIAGYSLTSGEPVYR